VQLSAANVYESRIFPITVILGGDVNLILDDLDYLDQDRSEATLRRERKWFQGLE
jgi:hypothetical protein